MPVVALSEFTVLRNPDVEPLLWFLWRWLILATPIQ